MCIYVFMFQNCRSEWVRAMKVVRMIFQVSGFIAFHLIDAYRLCAGVE